jgi:hypothetical protein
MNSHLFEHLSNEKFMDIMRSVLLFVGVFIVISVVGLAFYAAM